MENCSARVGFGLKASLSCRSSIIWDYHLDPFENSTVAGEGLEAEHRSQSALDTPMYRLDARILASESGPSSAGARSDPATDSWCPRR